MIRSILSISSAHILSTLLSYAYVVLCARKLPLAEYGTIALIMVIAGYLPALLDFGIRPVMIPHIKKRPQSRLPSVLYRFRLIVASACCTAGILWWLYVPGNTGLYGIAFGTLMAGNLLSAFAMLMAQANDNYKRMMLLTLLPNMIRICSALLLLMNSCFQVRYIIIFYAISSIIAGTASVIGIKGVNRRTTPSYRKLATRWYLAKTRYAMLFHGAVMTVMRADTLLLSLVATTAEVAKYSVGIQSATLFMLVGTAINGVLLPVMSGDSSKASKLLLYYAQKRFLPLLSCGVIVVYAMSSILPVILGGKFYEARITVFVIGVAYLLSMLNGPFHISNQLQNRFRHLTIMHTLQLMVMATLGIYMSLQFGAVGMAVTMLLTRIMTFLATAPKAIRYSLHQQSDTCENSVAL